MKTVSRRLSPVPIALAAALLTAFLVLAAPLSASAHDALISSSPEADATVETLPAELTLTFSAKLIDGEGATEVVVTDAAGRSVTDGPATTDGAIVTQPLVDEADAGVYHVVWKVVSSDGHPTSKEFSFTVAQSTLSTETQEPSTDPTTGPSQESTAPSQEESSAPATAEGSDAGDPTAVGAWIWVIPIAGILVVAAIVVLVLSRRGNRAPADSDDASAR